MSVLLNDDQRAVAEESRRVLEARMSDERQLAYLEQVGAYDEAFWTTAKEQGWTALALPEDFGGLDLGLVELGQIAHQAGRTLSGAPFLTASFGAARALLELGGDALKEQWLGLLAAGDAIGALAFAEHQAVLPSLSTVRFDGRTITGVKTGVLGGLHADLAVVLAASSNGPALVVAELARVERKPVQSFDNSRCAADLIFAAAPAALLVAGQQALEAALHILALQAVITAHEQTGGAEVLMERARDFANTRRAFGQPIGAFQSVKHRIAELWALVELARANAVHAASRQGQADFLRAAAAARISATEAYDTAARDCIQIHGGIGVTWEGALHLHMRRARSLALEQGNLMFWEDVLVDDLVKEAA